LYPILCALWRVPRHAVRLMPSFPLLLLVAAAPAAELAAASPALAAPEMLPLKRCYVSVDKGQREKLRTVATGFTPDAKVSITVGGETRDGTANHFGIVDLRLTAAPYRRRGERPFSVTVAENGNPLNTVSRSSRVTALDARLRPREANTSDRVRFAGRGFTAARPIWGHYVLRGHVKRTVRLARRPSSACGTFSVRRRQFPMRRVRQGLWNLQIDQQHSWAPRPGTVFKTIVIRVTRIIGA
jgi:hypothetical protein